MGTIITGKTCDELREDLNKMMAELEKKYDVSIKVGKMRYSDTHIGVKLDVETEGNKAKEDDLKSVQWEMDAIFYDLNEEAYGQEYEYKGVKYTPSKINARRKRMPVEFSVVGEPGKGICMTAEHARTIIGGAKKPVKLTLVDINDED